MCRTPNDFGDRVAAARSEASMTQADLAAKVGEPDRKGGEAMRLVLNSS